MSNVTVYTDENGVTREYREVERNAKENERIKMVTDCPCNGYKIGDVFVAICASSDGIVNFFDKDGDHRSKGPKCYVVLEPIESNVPDRLTALEQRVAALESQLSQISHVSVEMVRQQSEPCYTREQVIEMAKKDVANLLNSKHDKVPVLGSMYSTETYIPVEDGVRFIVNREKRTVVALISLQGCKPWARGIAHCAPDDCFNLHIGYAICIRRAFGLDVPDYYTNAPKPTEAQVGDVIRVVDAEYGEKIYTVVSNRHLFVPGKTAQVGSINANRGIVLDDSHDFGGEEA